VGELRRDGRGRQARAYVGEEWKKAAREEITGPQEMEELPWGPGAVRPYQVAKFHRAWASRADDPSRQQGYGQGVFTPTLK